MAENHLPSSASIAARLVYVQSCQQCRSIASGFAAGCIEDGAVTSVQLLASKKSHCHDVSPAELAAGDRAPATLEQVHELLLSFEPKSDTNGTLEPHELPNGFDPEDRG